MMNDTNTLVNRVAQSNLITIDLEHFYPKEEILTFDLKPFLFRELILKEKDFREALKQHDWAQYQDKYLHVFCSADAIIPTWAYMLIVSYAQPFAKDIFFGTKDAFIQHFFQQQLHNLNLDQYRDSKIVIKGCSDKPVPTSAYLELTKLLMPVASSIMYGEACSTVPVYKKPKQ